MNKYLPNIKDIIISEVGMPTDGFLVTDTVSFTTALAKEYMTKISKKCFDNKIKYYWFAAFDNSSKDSFFEQKWGLFTMEYDIKTNKYIMNQKYSISDLPNLY